MKLFFGCIFYWLIYVAILTVPFLIFTISQYQAVINDSFTQYDLFYFYLWCIAVLLLSTLCEYMTGPAETIGWGGFVAFILLIPCCYFLSGMLFFRLMADFNSGISPFYLKGAPFAATGIFMIFYYIKLGRGIGGVGPIFLKIFVVPAIFFFIMFGIMHLFSLGGNILYIVFSWIFACLGPVITIIMRIKMGSILH